MCDCGSVEEFDILKLQVAVKWPRGFNGNYFDIFAANVREYVLKPRLAAPHSIPKAFKTNDIESSNARAKLYIDHIPRNLYEAVYFMKKMTENVKFNFIQALYGEGPLKVAPDSNIKLIDKRMVLDLILIENFWKSLLLKFPSHRLKFILYTMFDITFTEMRPRGQKIGAYNLYE